MYQIHSNDKKSMFNSLVSVIKNTKPYNKKNCLENIK
jgi:hypothetical protein